MAVRPWGCAALVMIVSTVLFIVSVATNYWDEHLGASSGHYGLWQECGGQFSGDNTASNNNGCTDRTNAPSSLNAVRALTIIATVFAALSTLLYLHALYSTTKMGGFTAESLAFGAAIFGLIAMAVYIGYDHRADYGYSFGLEVAAWALSFLAGTSACILIL